MLVRLHRNKTTNANQFKRHAFGNARTAKKEEENTQVKKWECNYSRFVYVLTCSVTVHLLNIYKYKSEQLIGVKWAQDCARVCVCVWALRLQLLITSLGHFHFHSIPSVTLHHLITHFHSFYLSTTLLSCLLLSFVIKGDHHHESWFVFILCALPKNKHCRMQLQSRLLKVLLLNWQNSFVIQSARAFSDEIGTFELRPTFRCRNTQCEKKAASWGRFCHPSTFPN